MDHHHHYKKSHIQLDRERGFMAILLSYLISKQNNWIMYIHLRILYFLSIQWEMPFPVVTHWIKRYQTEPKEKVIYKKDERKSLMP